MGLTLIRKSQGTPPRKDPNIALVLAGGAVSGGAFKVGGLKALDDYFVGRKITDCDTYVGLSAGSLLAVSLAGGITPDEMLKVLEGTSGRFKQLGPLDFYNPDFKEYLQAPAKFLYDALTYAPGAYLDLLRSVPGLPDAIGPALRAFVSEPTYTRAETVAMELVGHIRPTREVPALTRHIPAGIFSTAALEKWLRENLQRIRMPNDFRAFERKRKRRLYITACDLDTAERVVFGADENCDLSISQAVQASVALPLFYKPPRLNGVDYVDGGVRQTANIEIAIEKGADLIICYNPFRPFLNRIDSEDGESRYYAGGRYLADRGIGVVLNQVFRTLLHSRLKLGIQRYLTDSRFRGDIVLIEPREHDADYFGINPVAFWKRAEAIRHGFESVRGTIEQNFEPLRQVFGRYGIELDRDGARSQAERLREARGWKLTEPEPEPL